MARYIDADELIRLIEIDALCQCGCFSKRDVIHSVKAINTAEVVEQDKYDEIVYKLECLLCHATGNKLSKHTYDLITMESVVTDYIDEAYSEGKEEGYKNFKGEVVKILSDLKKQIRERAVYPHSKGVMPYVTLKEIDAIIQSEMGKYKDGEENI